MDDVSMKTATQDGRIEYIDIAKAIAIFFVLLGHSVNADTTIKVLVYAFHMPAFFLLSGFSMKRHESFQFRLFINKKFLRLMLPYFIWGFIYMSFSFKNVLFLLYGTRETLLRAGSLSSLWFLPALFIASTIAEILIFYIHKPGVFVICTVVLYVAGYMMPHVNAYGDIWSIDIGLVSSAIVLTGYLLHHYFERMLNRRVTTFICIAVSFGLFSVGVWMNHPSVGYVLMANAIYGSPFFFLSGAVGGSVIVLILSAWLATLRFQKKFLLFIGRNTLAIFLIHKPFVELGRDVLTFFSIDYNTPGAAFVNAFVCLCISGVSVFLINRFCPTVFRKRI